MITKIRLSLLSLWFGVMALFSFVVAPGAFKVLPTQWLAGNLVNRVLGVTETIGIIVGVVLLLLLFAAKPARRVLLFEGITLSLMTLSMIVSKFVVSSNLHSLREKYGEALSTYPMTHPGREAFAEFHMFSTWLMGFNLLATLVLIVMLIKHSAEPQAVAIAPPAALPNRQHA